MIISNNLKNLSKIFHENCPLYIVGGYVRDFLLYKGTKDVDITSSLSSLKVLELLKDTNYHCDYVNPKLGTIIINIDDEKYEYTPFRKDNYSLDGTHEPNSIEFGVTQKDDFLRRDFTINALYYDIEKDEIIDFSTCKNDIENKIIRTVRDPENVFTEDALRILRMVRFSAVLGFNIEENTLFAGKKCKNLIKSLSNERIIDEYKKTIEKVNFDEMFYYLDLLNEEGVIETLYKDKVEIRPYRVSDGLTPYAPTIVFFYNALFERFFSYKLDFVTGAKLDSFSKIEVIEAKIFSEIDNIFISDKLPNKTRREIKEFIAFSRLILEAKNGLNLDIILTHYYNIINSELLKKQTRIMVRNNIILKAVSRFNTLKEQYPLRVIDLDIKGDELHSLGIKKEDTSKVLKTLLQNVICSNLKNDNETLKRFVMEEIKC